MAQVDRNNKLHITAAHVKHNYFHGCKMSGKTQATTSQTPLIGGQPAHVFSQVGKCQRQDSQVLPPNSLLESLDRGKDFTLNATL